MTTALPRTQITNYREDPTASQAAITQHDMMCEFLTNDRDQEIEARLRYWRERASELSLRCDDVRKSYCDLWDEAEITAGEKFELEDEVKRLKEENDELFGQLEIARADIRQLEQEREDVLEPCDCDEYGYWAV